MRSWPALALVVVAGCGDNRHPITTDASPDAAALCGDGIVGPGELCDDGNASDTDACLSSCRPARCGDGALHAGVEGCDAAGPTAYCDEQCRPSIAQVTAGGTHTCALGSNGAMRCWGFGGTGALGYGNIQSVGDPTLPRDAGDVPLGGVAVHIAAGQGHTCAVLDTGGVRCWGFANNGVLGYGNSITIGDNETPASVGDIDVGGRAIQVATGEAHTCALLDTGNVRCWGAGALGYGNTTIIGDTEAPATAGDVVVGGRVVQIVAGSTHTCALLDAGAVRCWGANLFGELGYARLVAIGDDELPESAGDVPLGGAAVQLAAGVHHTCAVLSTGAVRCWGLGARGQLGYGNTNDIGDDDTPETAGDVPLGERAVQIGAGSNFTCALLVTGTVRCWGSSDLGELGYGNVDTIGDDETPADAGDVKIGARTVGLAVGNAHTCVVLATGAVRCWGICGNGRCGYGYSAQIGDDEQPASAGDVPIL